MAGYSGTPLVQKLGIKPGHRVAIVEAPRHFRSLLVSLPPEVRLAKTLGTKRNDVIVYFVKAQAKLERRFAELADHLESNGGLWIAWPKKASGVASDITEDTIRAVALAVGLVDNKVCAIDETWSGLRCVIRVENRPKPSGFFGH